MHIEKRTLSSVPRLVLRAVLDPDRRAHKSKCRANLVLQKTLIREVQLHRAVGEQDERGRRHPCLRHVKNLDSLRHRDRSPLKIDLSEKTVHLTGTDTDRK